MYKFKLPIFLLLIIFLIFSFSITCFAKDSMYVWSNSSTPVNAPNTNDSSNANNNINSDILNLESPSAILIEQSTGQILYEHNAHEQLRPASVTKVMSILLIMEALDSGKITLDESIPCSQTASSMGGSQIWLDPRETLTVDEMLKAICVASANDYDVQKQEQKSI